MMPRAWYLRRDLSGGIANDEDGEERRDSHQYGEFDHFPGASGTDFDGFAELGVAKGSGISAGRR